MRAIVQPSAARLARLKHRRKLWLKVHLWLGLLFGAYLAVIGLTGSILVFHDEIDEWLAPELMTVEPPSETSAYRSLAAIIAASSAAMPSDAKQAFAVYPRNGYAAFRIRYALEATAGATEFWEVSVDPYRATVLGKRLRWATDRILPSTFIDFVFFLHYSLFLGENGELLVSLIGALSIISVLTGVLVWWPLTGKWRQAFTLKRKASAKRFVFDLHKTSGIYSTLVLLPVLFSGIYITEPKYLVPVVELFSPATYRYWFQSDPNGAGPALGMADALAIADRLYPDGRTHMIYGAMQPTSTFTVCKNGIERAGSLLARRCVVMDKYSGKVLDVDDPTFGTAGEVFSQWQWPLHSGQAFGWAGRVSVCISGVILLILFVTGVIRWQHKREAR